MDTVPTKVKARDIVVTFNALRDQRDEARTERDALREEVADVRAELSAVIGDYMNDAIVQENDKLEALKDILSEVLLILKAGHSTGRNAILALDAAEDVIRTALGPDIHSNKGIEARLAKIEKRLAVAESAGVIDALLEKLDDFCRAENAYEYGMPIHGNEGAAMREIVRDWFLKVQE